MKTKRSTVYGISRDPLGLILGISQSQQSAFIDLKRNKSLELLRSSKRDECVNQCLSFFLPKLRSMMIFYETNFLSYFVVLSVMCVNER